MVPIFDGLLLAPTTAIDCGFMSKCKGLSDIIYLSK
jgi:hypothetical protein